GDGGRYARLQLALPVLPAKPGFAIGATATAAGIRSYSLRSWFFRMKSGLAIGATATAAGRVV
ncbi:hypothetical protein, partial [Paenibacillus elgii]